jgi:hypothetical protein
MNHDDDEYDSRHPAWDVGTWIVFGAMGGTLVFAITGDALWIGIGAALGILLAGVSGLVRNRKDPDQR